MKLDIKKIKQIKYKRDVLLVSTFIAINVFFITWLFYDLIVFSFVVACFAFIFGLAYVDKIIEKRKRKKIEKQFLELLEIILIGMESGETFPKALESAYNILVSNAKQKTYIIKELEIIISKRKNNISLSDALLQFSNGLEINSINSFCEVYELASRSSNDINLIVKKNIELLNDSFKIESEIDSILLSKKLEVVILCMFPPILMIFFRGFYPSYCQYLFLSSLGRVTVTIAIFLFIIAGWVANKIIKSTYDY